MASNRISRRKLVAILNIVLTVAFVILVLYFAREMLSSYFGKGAGDEGKPAEKVRPVKIEERRAFEAYSPILANNVFGFDAGKLTLISGGKVKSPGMESAGATRADLMLIGTVSWPEGVGYAFISGPGKDQDVYKTGDYIQGAGYLRRVEPDKVVIETGGGGKEELYIADIVEVHSAPATGRRNGLARKTSENSYVLDKKIIQGSFENPKNIMTDARLLPNIVDGVQEGFMVREVKRKGIYHNLGIRNGDVLLRVNEFEISDAETALQAFNALRGLDRVELDILRKGSPLTLTYTLR
jgi:general secretion pathway protein C